MRVKWMASTGLHVRADQKKLFVVHDIVATNPLFESPGRLEINFLCGSDESARIAHIRGVPKISPVEKEIPSSTIRPCVISRLTERSLPIPMVRYSNTGKRIPL